MAFKDDYQSIPQDAAFSASPTKIFPNKFSLFGQRLDLSFTIKASFMLCFWFISLILYETSLEGAPDIEQLRHKFGSLGVQLIFSVAFFCFSNILLLITSFPGTKRRLWKTGLLVFFLSSFLTCFVADQGDDTVHHGCYNSMVWCFLVTTVHLVFLILYGLKSFLSTASFIKVVGGSILAFALLLTLALSRGASVWPLGIGNSATNQIAEKPSGEIVCQWPKNGNWPWYDLLPNGGMNFWTGSQSCPKDPGISPNSWNANLHHSLLTIKGCKKDAAYQVFPDTRSWSLEEKEFLIFAKNVNERMPMITYTHPIKLQSQPEVVLAFCGESRKVLVEVQRQPSLFEKDTGKNESRFDSDRKPPNVLFLFSDAVSRRHFIRKLPKTVEILKKYADVKESSSSKKKNANSKLFQFYRYHIVGPVTDQNTRAMYTGDARLLHPPLQTIWETFQSRGYATMWADTNCMDWSQSMTGSISSKYFSHEFLAPSCHPDVYPDNGHPHAVFNGPFSIRRRCFAGRYQHETNFKYLSKFIQTYSFPDNSSSSPRPWLAMMNLIEGHEGTGEVLSTLDDSFSNLMVDLEKKGIMENTAVFFIGDHGLHMGLNFIFTKNGKIEHANPHLFMILPPSIYNMPSLNDDDSVEEGLKHNEQALITAVDVHYTLKSILKLNGWYEKKEDVQSVKIVADKQDTVLFSKSLFAKQSYRRTCESEKIPSDLCWCKFE